MFYVVREHEKSSKTTSQIATFSLVPSATDFKEGRKGSDPSLRSAMLPTPREDHLPVSESYCSFARYPTALYSQVQRATTTTPWLPHINGSLMIERPLDVLVRVKCFRLSETKIKNGRLTDVQIGKLLRNRYKRAGTYCWITISEQLPM
ncbi:hypothetical protein Trydic_g840 [Trypoxylus dichotomus]